MSAFSEARRHVGHEEFAERAAVHLEAVADRIEAEARLAGEDLEAALRAGEMRVAARIVRDEAMAVSRGQLRPAEDRGSPRTWDLWSPSSVGR
jgi:hypothetical protein